MGGDLTAVRGLSNGKSLSMSAISRSHFGMPAPPPGSHGQPSGDPREVLTLDHFEGAVERSPFATQLGASRAHRRPRTIPSPRSLALRDLTAVDAGQGVMGDGLVRRAGVRGLRIRAGIGVGDTYIYGHRPPPLYPRFDLVYLPLYPRSFSFPPPLGPSLASDIDGDPDTGVRNPRAWGAPEVGYAAHAVARSRYVGRRWARTSSKKPPACSGG